ncbi:MAG: preprotein translocase subunit YajC [bacterium]|nr:preprotein translocase subunit YajC [bacterium]
MEWTEYLAQQSAAPSPAEVAQPQGGDPASGGGSAPAPGFDWTFFLILGGVFVFMYFMMIRPQRQEEKRKKDMLSTLQKGDQVVTTSGILGSVASVKEDTIMLNIGDGARVEFLRSAVASVRDKSKK